MRRRKQEASGRRFVLESSVATCLIGLGANQGDRAANLAAAVELLSRHRDVRRVCRSRIYASRAAVGGARQNAFLNSAVTCQTSLTPASLLAALQEIENQLGRTRQDRWSPRQIDVDLLLYDDLIHVDQDLILPHPRMAFRRFVLDPAAEIAPNFVHATTRFTISELRTRLDRLPRRISITGVTSRQSVRLARQAAAKSNAVFVAGPGPAALIARDPILLASPTSQTAVELTQPFFNELRTVRRECALSDAANATEIGGFWIGESRAVANLLLPAEELDEFERYWSRPQVADELDRTTLIAVLLDTVVDQQTARLQEEIQRLATTPRQSVWLFLDARDPAWALTELVAATEAMQQ